MGFSFQSRASATRDSENPSFNARISYLSERGQRVALIQEYEQKTSRLGDDGMRRAQVARRLAFPTMVAFAPVGGFRLFTEKIGSLRA
jgi:hypothetical protein